MSRAATFHQADLDRALAVAEKHGLKVSGYEITRDGTIRVLTGAAETPKPALTPLQEWRQKRGPSAA